MGQTECILSNATMIFFPLHILMTIYLHDASFTRRKAEKSNKKIEFICYNLLQINVRSVFCCASIVFFWTELPVPSKGGLCSVKVSYAKNPNEDTWELNALRLSCPCWTMDRLWTQYKRVEKCSMTDQINFNININCWIFRLFRNNCHHIWQVQ